MGLAESRVELRFIRPGKLVQNAFVESFNGKFRDECLSEHWFLGLDEARQVIEEWREDYNQFRPHSSLDVLTPEQFRDRSAVLRTPPAPAGPQTTNVETGRNRDDERHSDGGQVTGT